MESDICAKCEGHKTVRQEFSRRFQSLAVMGVDPRDLGPMHVVIVDNADSFTWNLWQQVRSLGARCTVISAAGTRVKDVAMLKPDRIIISPGPHRPEDASASLRVIRSFAPTVPLLGVCLGHQCLGVAFGDMGAVQKAREPVHGKTSLVRHTGASIFAGVPNPLRVGRYHSLLLTSVPKDFELLAWAGNVRRPEIMAIRHRQFPVFGVQFHPESFLTQSGDRLMKNFLTGSW